MKLVIIDGNAIMHRAYHAIPNLTNRIGEPTNAVYGLTSMLAKIIEDIKPTHIAVCFDRPEPTFRKQEYKEYQSKRPEMESDLSSQFEKAKGVLKSANIQIFEKAGFEADDIIGTISFLVSKIKDSQTIIVTGDKDILQLVNDENNIKVYMPVKGLSESMMLDEKGVMEKLKVSANKIVDYKALVGDSSDNYPGVRGIGPVGAVKLLSKYGSFLKIYDHLGELDDKTRILLEKYKDDAFMSFKLANIITNVEIEFSIDSLAKWNLGSDKLQKEFENLSFKSLAVRVKKLAAKLESEKQMVLL